MNKKLVMLLVTLLPFLACGQMDSILLDNHYQITTDTQSAIIKRKILAYKDDGLIEIEDYAFETSVIKFKGEVEFLNSHRHSGDSCVYFHENGIPSVKCLSTFENNNKMLIEYQTHYHPNGALAAEIKQKGYITYYLNTFDSLGNPEVQNGEGYFKSAVSIEGIRWEGLVKKKVRVGIWKGYNAQNNFHKYDELYTMGRLQHGILHSDGVDIKYREKKVVVVTYFQRKILKPLLTTIFYQRDKSSVKFKNYHFMLIYAKGQPVELVQLIKNRDEKLIDLSKFQYPILKRPTKYQGELPAIQYVHFSTRARQL